MLWSPRDERLDRVHPVVSAHFGRAPEPPLLGLPARLIDTASRILSWIVSDEGKYTIHFLIRESMSNQSKYVIIVILKLTLDLVVVSVPAWDAPHSGGGATWSGVSGDGSDS